MIWKYHTNVSKIFLKISHSEIDVSLYWPNFSEEVSQPTDQQTYKKFSTIWNLCTLAFNNFRTLACVLVFLLAHYLAEIRLTLFYLQFGIFISQSSWYVFTLFSNYSEFLFVFQSFVVSFLSEIRLTL